MNVQTEERSKFLRPSEERRKVVLIGDSITQQSFSIAHSGWGAGLADWYQRSADVINRGYSGYNSRWIKQGLHKIFPASDTVSRDVILVTVFLGANDAACLPSPQHVSLEEYKLNMIAILAHIRVVYPYAQCILITPPQVKHMHPHLHFRTCINMLLFKFTH
jgi:lysophospholipase L1-like esterase